MGSLCRHVASTEEMQQRQLEAYTREASAEARIEQNCVLDLPKTGLNQTGC